MAERDPVSGAEREVASRVRTWLRLFAVLLAAILIPFGLWGAEFERWGSELAAREWSSQGTAMFVILLLAADTLLPIPSSLVLAWSGYSLGFALGAATSWAGLMLGLCLGWALGRFAGSQRLMSLLPQDERLRLEGLLATWGAVGVALTRGIPVIAEAASLLAGYGRMPFGQVLLGGALGNGVLAVLLSASGAATERQLAAGLICVVAGPTATWLAWRCWASRR